ncbi:universal stress protein [Robertkochia sediminum]|uniref:universal stress protein n=1 Tax=Robertkochia sediminum TaxID=2785326 RepID=UPI00193366BF|nr:universal stress protein [Robertkochia sediminum]MBL7471351.1 universal stress protein [Robertkochia sediminum]
MKSIKKILVALDLSEIDIDLIDYASFLSNNLGVEEVYFVHNMKKFEISDLFREQLADIDLEQIISDELDEKVAQHFKADAKTEVLIAEDPYTETLINYVAQSNMIDLVLIGHKDKHMGTGIISDKLLRTLKCDILVIPQHPELRLDKVWAGTDFSPASRKIFSRLHLLHDKMNTNVVAAHIYHVPVQFSPYLDKEEMVPKIEKHINQKFDKFLARSPFPDISKKIIRGRNATIPEKLTEMALRDGSALLVTADKGSNVFSSLLVGSVTDELFRTKLPFPLWVVK